MPELCRVSCVHCLGFVLTDSVHTTMKTTHAFTLFSFLAFCFFFSGISGDHGQKDECIEFPKPEKGGQIFCTDDYKPVCGTNGVTYPNRCALCADQAAGVHVHIKHDGECKGKPDVCSKFPQQEKGKPAGCTKEYRPVCGTNGVTYANLCLFCAAKRDSEVPLDIKHEGECKPDVCSKFPQQEKGKPAGCTKEYRPVCGTNGVTYANLCLFCAAKRDSEVPLDIKHEGECKDVCSKFPEPPKGQAPKCTLEWKPVCGSDGQTYGNLCAFCHARRQSGNTITISHKGPCKGKDECSDFPVPPKGKPAICTFELAEVCGSDGVTYPNKCTFCDAKRKSGGKLTIKHEGPCEEQGQKGE
uniref:ovomucoid-like isoform X1 n=1 Tax=Podarcis muralis TaxID=64176 RepID=UPI00109F58DB|nr:ovomucoid-like isoform X1 [Podarcis muralis]